jgi:hypothetical protein
MSSANSSSLHSRFLVGFLERPADYLICGWIDPKQGFRDRMIGASGIGFRRESGVDSDMESGPSSSG